MFEKISDTLPIYGDFVTRLQARASNRGESYPRLATALSYLYVDTLRFCHDICLLFSQKRNGKTFLRFAHRNLTLYTRV